MIDRRNRRRERRAGRRPGTAYAEELGLASYRLSDPLERRHRSWRWRLAAAFLAVLLLLAGALFYLDGRMRREEVLAGYPGRPADGPGTVWMIVGSDSRAGLSEEQRRRFSTGKDVGRRADTMMLLHTGDHGTTLVSLPRDSYVPIPGRGRDKLNAAFASGGPQLLSRTVEAATGLRVDHYAEIGFGGFVGMVDAVGGVRMCVKRAVRDKKAGLDLPAGCRNLDGGQALGYVRSRHAFPGGDFDRVKHQRELLAKLISKATSPGVLLNPLRSVPFALDATESFSVDDGEHLWGMARLGLAMRGVSKGGGVTTTVPTAGGGSAPGVGSYVRWDPARSGALFGALRADRPVPKGL